eukprot:scaffold20489_cov159-Amphora_coffeaeformis.AAC.5
MPAIQEIQVDLTELLQGPAIATAQDSAVSAKLIVPCRNVLGEGIIYNPSTECVLWTDIMGYCLYKLDLNEGQGRLCKFEMPKKVGSIGLVATEQQQADTLPILCAWEDGFQLYDVENERGLSEKSTGEDVNPAKGPTRLNDGKTDPTGARFICGGYYGEYCPCPCLGCVLQFVDPPFKKNSPLYIYDDRGTKGHEDESI